MTLDYAALVILIIVLLLVVYGVVAVWAIPYEIAKRGHPHQDAIGAATWSRSARCFGAHGQQATSSALFEGKNALPAVLHADNW